MKYKTKTKRYFKKHPFTVAIISIITLLGLVAQLHTLHTINNLDIVEVTQAREVRKFETLPYVTKQEKKYYEVTATVTAYNTVDWQTDSTPCIAANGSNICGRSDTIACPRGIPFGTWVSIDDRMYECVDRTASKYDGRFDINMNMDIDGARAFGKKSKTVKVYK